MTMFRERLQGTESIPVNFDGDTEISENNFLVDSAGISNESI